MEEETNECEIAVNSLLTDNDNNDDDDGLEEETNCSYITSGNQIFTDDATMVLIDHYKNLRPQIGKTFKTRTKMFQHIAKLMEQQGYNYSPAQLDDKFRGLKRGYLRRLTQSFKKGKRVKSLPFDKHIMEALYSNRLLDVKNDHPYDDRTYTEEPERANETTEDNNTTLYLFETPTPFEEDTMGYNLPPRDDDLTDMEFLQQLGQKEKDADDQAHTETITKSEACQIEKGIWTPAATDLLIKLTQKYYPNYRATFITKKNMWHRISKDLNEKGYHYNVTQVENKFRTMKRQYPKKKNRIVLEKSNLPYHYKRKATPALYQNDRNPIEVPVVPKVHMTRSTTNTSIQGKPKVVFLRNTKAAENNDKGLSPPKYGKRIIAPTKYTENEMFDRKMELKKKQIASIEKLSEKLDVTNSILHNIMLELRRQSGS